MHRLAKNRLAAALLGLWVALAPALAAFPAAAMTFEMSLSGASAPECCDGCQPDEIDCDICTALCRIAAQAATAGGGRELPPGMVLANRAARHPAPPGTVPPPDPAPPKPVPHI